MSIIKVEELTKIYRQRQRGSGFVAAVKTLIREDTVYKTAVDNISFDIGQGDMVAFLGPNGAGKTTVLKILAGILYPTQGNILVAGYIPCLREEAFKKKIALIVGQKNQMMWDLPAIDTLKWLKVIYDIGDDEFECTLKMLTNIFEADDLLNLQVRRMSLGQRMKMELIAAIIHNPSVVFLDEPTIGLDVMAQNNFREFIKEYNRQTGATVILTSHNLKDVESLCSKVILINKGRITYNDTLDNLVREYCNYKVVYLKGLVNPISKKDLPNGIAIISHSYDEAVLGICRDASKEMIKFIWTNYLFDDFSIEDIELDTIIENAFKNKEVK